MVPLKIRQFNHASAYGEMQIWPSTPEWILDALASILDGLQDMRDDSALCQAIGTLVAKPAMADGMDPIAASAIRVSVAGGVHVGLLWLGIKVARPTCRPNVRVLAQTAASGLVSIALGMTFLLLALKLGDVGMVAILSSVTPILLLPLLCVLDFL